MESPRPSRCTFIKLSAILCSLSCLLAQPKFWTTENPTDYSDDEKRAMVVDSPWAKVTRAEVPGVTMRHTAGFKSVPGAAKHPKTVAVQSSPQPEPDDGALAFYGPVTVRWESAEPILQVTRTYLPDQFKNHYVISVTGLPSGILSNGSTPLPAAVLSARTGPPERAEFVALTGDKRTLLFAFPKRNPAIKARDKALSFRLDLSGIRIQAKFEPKRMIDRGHLAL